MKDKFIVLPKRVARGRKIQVRQFEPEEIWIEYELNVVDPSSATDAVQEASRLASAYLDEEEKRLRGNNRIDQVHLSSNNKKVKKEYNLELTDQGVKEHLRVVKSKDPQFNNFIHLWHGNGNGKNETYIGHLKKDTGEFKFKSENKSIIDRLGINEGTHFKIISV